MAVQQNKKSPSKRGMHRAHDSLPTPAARGRADHRRSAPAPPHQPQRLLPRQEGRQDQGRRVAAASARRDGASRDARLHAHPHAVTVAVDAWAATTARRSRCRRRSQFLDEHARRARDRWSACERADRRRRSRSRARPRASALTVHAASEVVDDGRAAGDALRSKKDSSMRVAINLVKDGDGAGVRVAPATPAR